jgi:hypothetical protein
MEQSSSIRAGQAVDGVAQAVPCGVQAIKTGDACIAILDNGAQDLRLHPELEGLFCFRKKVKAQEPRKDAVAADALLRQDGEPPSGAQEGAVQMGTQALEGIADARQPTRIIAPSPFRKPKAEG